MRMLALVVLAAACGGSPAASPPARAPAPAPTPPAPAPPPPPPPVEPAAAPAPPPAPEASIRERLRDTEGELPGMPGWRVSHKADATVCGGTRVDIARGKRKLDPDQQALAKVYALALPNDLVFDPANPEVKAASMKRLTAFMDEMQATSKAAIDRYAGEAKDPAMKPAAAARVAQVYFRIASVLARAPIPKDVRSGELQNDKVAAYCDAMEEIAEPMLKRAEEVLPACAAVTGWWTPLCATGASAPAPSP